MLGMTFAEAIGFFGVSLLLAAFFLNLWKLMQPGNYPYILLNLFGATLSCLASYLVDFMPFVLLEGVWALVALTALLKLLLGYSAPERTASP
ncbi:MAG TPA: hypothetical protein VJS40_05955 [Aestuariivirgaceae bacterium]|nr:hypothetical protein [Aestuariivirgaceae bacterium]